MVDRKRVGRLSGLGVVALAIAWASVARSEPQGRENQEPHRQFLRVVREEGVPVALETAVVRHVPQDCGRTSPTVDLVATVHVGDEAYYAALNKLFEKYDAVLYELVAPEGTTIPKGGPQENLSFTTRIQTGMTSVLGLEFQLRAIDYTRPNFVHADMSPEEFARSMAERGESMLQVFARLVAHALTRVETESSVSPGQVLAALLSGNRTLVLRRLIAEQFEDMEGSLKALEGPDGSTLISQRNKKALEVLRRQLAAGKRTVAIFYGAGHMPDLQKRLAEEFNLVPISTEWFTAWDMRGDLRGRAR